MSIADDLSPPTLLRNAYEAADLESSRGVPEYLRHVVIDSKPEPRLFRDVAEPWQWALIARIAPAVEAAAGVFRGAPYGGPRSFWLTMPKGHDKTTLIGRMLNWALAYARTPSFNAYAAAVDKEQAALLSEAMATEASLNPWLGRHLKFGNWKVDGRGTLKILASDSHSAQGSKPDFLVMDEVTLWKDEDFFDALVSGTTKRKGMVTLVITNAGWLHTWQRRKFEEVAAQPKRWWHYEAPGRIASWMDPAEIEANRRLILPAEARRLYDNQWVDPAEGAGFVTREDVIACGRLGKDLGLLAKYRGEGRGGYVASIDYGPVRDRTVMAVMHHDRARDLVVVDRMDVLQGSRKNRVPIAAVEAWLDQVMQAFPLDCVVIDPYQMESTIQKYRNKVVVEPFEPRGGKANYELAQTLRSLVANHKIAWYPGCGDVETPRGPHTLADEFCELIVRNLAYGYRIDHPPGKHDDRVVCLGMGAVAALRVRPKMLLRESEWYW